MLRLLILAVAFFAGISEMVHAEGPEHCDYPETNPVCTDLLNPNGDGMFLASWYYRYTACAKLTVRSYNADGSKREQITILDAGNPNHATVPYCVARVGSWFQGEGYEIHDHGVTPGSGRYAVVRMQIRSALTGLVYDRYASSDGRHSTAAAWTGGPGNFASRWCLDPTVGWFWYACEITAGKIIRK